MDPAALASRLEAIDGRLAGTDAERRAAALCAQELRAIGRSPRTDTLWWRPQRATPRILWALLGVAASLVAVSHAVTGAAIAGGALLAAVLDAAGIRVIAPLLVRHATQNVLAPPPERRAARVVLMLVASVDAPRRSLAARFERFEGRRPVPGPLALLLLGLLGVLACAAARAGGAEGTAVGAIQLVPSALLILLAGLYLDQATGRVASSAPASGAAVAVALAGALDARPPRFLAPEVVIAGAGHAGADGMAAIVRARRRRLAAEDVIVLELGSAGGPVRHVARDGELLGSRLHPRLLALAEALPAAREAQARTRSAARTARGAGWPAIRLEGDPRPLAAAALRLIAAIDREVGERRGGDAHG